MEFIIPMIISLIGGMFSGGVQQSQQNRQARAEAEAERERARVQSELAEARREQIQEQVAGYAAELESFRERVRRGAEYSGLEAGASREASRNTAAARAAAALSGVGDSGMAESQAGAIMADAIGQTALARQQDQLQRQQLVGGQEQQLRQLVTQMMQDPAFRIGTPEQQAAGIDELLAGIPGSGGAALVGGIGSVLPLIAQWGMGALGERFPTGDAATNADAQMPGQTLPPFMMGYQQQPMPNMFNAPSWLANTSGGSTPLPWSQPWGGSPQYPYRGG